jgi:integrase
MLLCVAMTPLNVDDTASHQDVEPDATRHTGAQESKGVHIKSGKQVANQLRAATGKNDSRYWLSRIFCPVNDRGEVSPHYSMKVQFRGRRMAFTLGTANKEAGARRASGIYTDLLTLGVEATLAKHRTQRKISSDEATTVGEWIEAARRVSATNAATFAQYAASLRLIVGQILSVKKTKNRFGPGKGGAQAYRATIDAASLEILSAQALQRWRLAYVAQARNPAQERSRMTSANSTIRQARSLFADKIVRFLPDVRLPSPRPFSDVEFFPKQSARYFSRIDPKALLRKAQTELAENDPSAFLAMLLALAAGLRRGEILSLAWPQIDFERASIRIEATESASLKTADSRGEVRVDDGVISILRGFRANAVFTRLNHWLRKHGVTARKPMHELRKELGALVTAEHGIYAASRVLRHSSVATTAAHYTDLKTRPTMAVGSWLTPANVIAMTQSGKPLFPLPKGSEGWVKLAECEEFCLYRKPDGMTITIRSNAVKLAYWKARFVISNADNKKRSVEDRTRLALALRRLALYTRFSLPQGDDDDGWAIPLVRELAETLGQLLLEAKDRENPADAVDRCANIFRDALDDVAKEREGKGGKGKRSLRIRTLIEVATCLFQAERRRPTKSRLREEMAAILGLAPKGKNLKSDWRGLFTSAGLSGLPEE